MSKQPERSNLDTAAELLCERLRSLDPSWRMRLDAVRLEKGLSDREICECFMGYILRNSLQFEALIHDPIFDSRTPPIPATAKCECCAKPFQPQWPGQRYCGNLCTEKARKSEGTFNRLAAPAPAPAPEPPKHRDPFEPPADERG